MMSRKDYVKFAGLVKGNQIAFTSDEMKPLRDLLYILETDNANFDETRFLKAAGIGPYTGAIISVMEIANPRA